MHVQSGVTLAIEAGAVVKLARGATLVVDASRRLLINRASGAPVTITGRDDNSIS